MSSYFPLLFFSWQQQFLLKAFLPLDPLARRKIVERGKTDNRGKKRRKKMMPLMLSLRGEKRKNYIFMFNDNMKTVIIII